MAQRMAVVEFLTHRRRTFRLGIKRLLRAAKLHRSRYTDVRITSRQTNWLLCGPPTKLTQGVRLCLSRCCRSDSGEKKKRKQNSSQC